MKRILLAAGAIVALLVTLTLGYVHYRGSPSYALAQIESAVEEGNRLRFQQHVDLDRFLETTMDQLMGQATLDELASDDSDGFEALGTALGTALADGLKTTAVQELRRATLEAVDEGRLAEAFSGPEADEADDGSPADDEADLAAVGGSLGVSARTFEGIGDITIEGDAALAELLFRQPRLDTTLVLQIRMEHTDDRWRVVAPEDLDSYMHRIETLREAHLAELNEEEAARARQMLEVGTPERSTEDTYSISVHEITVPVTNISEGPVHIVTADLRPPAGTGADGDVREFLSPDARRLAPGEATTLTTTLIEGIGLDVHPAYLGDGLSEMDVDVELVAGEGEDARYVGPYWGWNEYVRRTDDPDAFAGEMLAAIDDDGASAEEGEAVRLPERTVADPWTVNEDTDPLDDSPRVTLFNISAGESSYREPTLILRCRNNRTEVFISWNDYLGSGRTMVEYRIDDGEPRRQSWSQSTNGQATFYPGNHIAFIRELEDASRLVARVTPYSSSPVTAIFELRGLDEHVGKLQEACNWG